LASFDNHIQQVKKNLSFLEQTNALKTEFWDWQVTITFYVGVHLVNAHLASVADLHYRTHEHVKNEINPHNPDTPYSFPEAVYLDYAKLEGLSRRSRYLCHDSPDMKDNKNAHFTFDKHFAKAVKCLDRLLAYFNTTYGLGIKNISVKCVELSPSTPLTVFKVKNN
jgi:hypothetical protein